MEDFILALRNIGRNCRRSLVTIMATALCCAGLILFAGYVSCTFRGDETRTVCVLGHLQIFKKGFYEKGMGNPPAFALDGYEDLKREFTSDPLLQPLLNVVTGQLTFTGLVSCYEKDTSAGFIGAGLFPEDVYILHNWNPYRIMTPYGLKVNDTLFGNKPDIAADDVEGGSLSVGLARILEMRLDEKPAQGLAPGHLPAAAAVPPSPAETPNFDAITSTAANNNVPATGVPSVELLAASRAGSSPNVTTMRVRAIKNRPTKEMEDRLILLHVKHASNLLFPGETLKVTSVVLQLHRSEDVPVAAERVRQILAEKRPDLECRTWLQLSPFYTQLTTMFGMMFTFMFCIIAVIVVFTIYNTLAMAIVERTKEIGTLRALGLTRARVRKLFFYEGMLMGVIGGVLGVALALVAGWALNSANFTYMPPTTGFHTKLEVLILRNPIVIVQGFAMAVLTSMFSAILPARQAAALSIVAALRRE
jgi:putative ABC transport system permease protein